MNNKYDSNRIVKEAYENLDVYVDSFETIKDIHTDLMYGEPIEDDRDILLTLIIPTYNRDVLLKEAINSVLNQKPVDYIWEFIIIDNTELDENQETPALRIVREIGNKKIMYYHNRVNIGSGYNWNRGVQLAKGKWICLLHDDDVLCMDALANIGKLIRKFFDLKKPLGYIHARSFKFQDSFDEKCIRFKNLCFNLELTRLTTLLLGHTHTGMPTCGTTILREAYIEAGGINYDFGPTADAVLGYIIMKNYTVLRSGVILGGYRWGCNETLKVSTIEKLLQSDSLFAEYRYQNTILGILWKKLFGDCQKYINYCSKNKLIKINNKKMKPVLCYTYKKSIVSLCIYKLCLNLIKFIMCIKGIVLYS